MNEETDQYKQRKTASEDSSHSLNHTAFLNNETGLYTRQYFEDRIEQEIYRAERYRHYLSLAVINIDNKSNKFHKSGTGVSSLQKKMFSTILKECKRRMDVACQYNDKSLFILLPETPSDDAQKVALRIKQTFEEFMAVGSNGEENSISAKVSTYPTDARTGKELIEHTIIDIKNLN